MRQRFVSRRIFPSLFFPPANASSMQHCSNESFLLNIFFLTGSEKEYLDGITCFNYARIVVEMFITLTRDVDTLVRERLFRETNGKMSQRLFNSGQFKLSKDEGERRIVDNLYVQIFMKNLKDIYLNFRASSWRKNNKRVIENGVYFYTVAVTRFVITR